MTGLFFFGSTRDGFVITVMLKFIHLGTTFCVMCTKTSGLYSFEVSKSSLISLQICPCSKSHEYLTDARLAFSPKATADTRWTSDWEGGWKGRDPEVHKESCHWGP